MRLYTTMDTCLSHCRYPLLLNELIAATQTTHPDHTFLVRAATKMGEVAAAINEGKRRKELVNKCVQYGIVVPRCRVG